MDAKRILIVEDEADILDLLTLNLIRKGHLVKPARNCAAALAALHEQSFDLILSDNLLPDGLGVDLLAKLKNEKGLEDCRFVLMTAGMAMNPWDDEALADAFLDKPFSISEMLTMIQNLLDLPQPVPCVLRTGEELQANL